MKSLVILVLFVGMFLIVQGVFDGKLKAAQENKQIEYKFIPRTYYEEQLDSMQLQTKMSRMFDQVSPWFDRVNGPALMPDKSSIWFWKDSKKNSELYSKMDPIWQDLRKMQYVYIPLHTAAGLSTWERNENDNFPIKFATVNLSIWYN